MKKRCFRTSGRDYQYYAGKGITVCDRWRDSFDNFLADMGPRPSPKHSIDRIDNDGNYEPSNCRWATWSEQNNNRRSNRILAFDGQAKTITQWAEFSGIDIVTIHARLRRGWSVSRAVTSAARPCRRPGSAP
jgi:hypothetical protein